MTSCTRGNSNTGLVTSILLCKKLHAEKLGYTVKFQEAVQSSNVVSSTSFFRKVTSSHAVNEVRHKEVTK